MRRVEIGLILAVCAASAFAQSNAAQNYNKADTFEPGKKYNCVPTADHKGWDCSESGKAVEIKPKENEPAHQAAAQPAPAEATAPPSPPPSQPSSRSTLPSYLTNAAASNPAPAVEEPPSTVSAAAAHANAPAPISPPPAPPAKPVVAKPPKTTSSKPVAVMPPPAKAVVAKPPKSLPPKSASATPPVATTRTVPLTPTGPKPGVAPPPRPAAKPAVSPRATHAPLVEAASGGGEFMSLPSDHFVIEMAHAASKSELDAVKTSTHVPNGDLYELHLRQNGADSWLLLWGSFDTIEAARAARNTISASATPGWPRRIAPLQAEARRVSR